MIVTKIIEGRWWGRVQIDGRRYQTANTNHSGHTTVTTGGQPCELVATGFREKKEIRKQINWETVKIDSM